MSTEGGGLGLRKSDVILDVSFVSNQSTSWVGFPRVLGHLLYSVILLGPVVILSSRVSDCVSTVTSHHSLYLDTKIRFEVVKYRHFEVVLCKIKISSKDSLIVHPNDTPTLHY